MNFGCSLPNIPKEIMERHVYISNFLMTEKKKLKGLRFPLKKLQDGLQLLEHTDGCPMFLGIIQSRLITFYERNKNHELVDDHIMFLSDEIKRYAAMLRQHLKEFQKKVAKEKGYNLLEEE